ncbi:TPA: hypothetical protein MEB29_003674 [Klebsiella aerogenes]|nr:hypothetical protein [Klebsiella aerogenes]
MVPDGWRLTGLDGVGVSIIDGDRGKSYPKKDDYLSDGYALFIGAENIANGYFSLNKAVFISKEKHEEMRKGIVQDKDIILVMRGNGTGRSCIFYKNKIHGKVARINSGLVIIRASEEYTDVNFLHQLFLSDIIKKQFDGFIFGSAQPQLTVSLLKALVIPIPPFYEQVKIACILSVWDKAILLSEQLLRNSLQLKNTLMQSVITGKKRFLEFKGQWDKRTLSDICILGAGQPAPQEEKYFFHGEHDFIRVSDLGSNTSRWAPQSRDKINQLAIRECKLELVPARATLFTKSGASLLLNQRAQLKESSFIVSHLGFAKAKDGVSDDFVFYLMCSIDFNRYAAGTSLPALQLSVLKSLKVLLPPFEEQQQIASMLSDADAEISILEKKLFLLKQEKKALMQQLLTGKRRVKTEAA